jgi:1-acyl-sn-glycerol-3-phosphate acyltransferase
MKPRLPVTVKFGAPMHVSDHGDPADPRTIRVFADAVMFEIAQLSGQKYVHTYAGAEDKPDTPSTPTTPSAPTKPTISVPSGRTKSARPAAVAALT